MQETNSVLYRAAKKGGPKSDNTIHFAIKIRDPTELQNADGSVEARGSFEFATRRCGFK